MSDFSDYAENAVIQFFFRSGTPTKPTNLTVRLWTSLPAEDGTGGVEVSGGSYTAVSRAPLDANWAAPSGGNGQTSNVAEIAFPAPTADWGSLVGFTIEDHLGNHIVRKAFASAKTVNNGDPAPKFNAAGLTVTVG